MKELIKIVNGNGVNTVSARELYDFLEVGTKFNDWIIRMLEYGFTDGSDYSKLSTDNERFTFDYELTLDCAKEISMLQRTDKGKQARQYFIQKEKELREVRKIILPTKKELALMVIEAEEKIEQLELTVKAQAPKVKYYEDVLQSESLITSTIIAKDLGMTAQRLNKLLHQHKIIYNSGGTWVLYEKHQNKGYTKTMTHTRLDTHGKEQTYIHTYWTEKGRQAVITFIKNLQILTSPKLQ